MEAERGVPAHSEAERTVPALRPNLAAKAYQAQNPAWDIEALHSLQLVESPDLGTLKNASWVPGEEDAQRGPCVLPDQNTG